MRPLDGKVAIVTGASSPEGLGAAIARRLAASGARLLLNADGPRDSLDGVAKECATLHGDTNAVAPLIGDLSDPAAVAAMVAETEKRFGRIDLLVNNAGIRMNRKFGAFSVAEFDQTVAVN